MKNNRLQTINSSEIEKIDWMRIGNKPGIRICLSSGIRHRFGGFAEKVQQDFEEVKKFALDRWNIDVDPVEQCIKGWNYGKAEVKGKFYLAIIIRFFSCFNYFVEFCPFF
ncbi:unnamed protein product [Onchocerca flexuosa]|uniref:POB3_N domain-containing protein n=1 Tax=Onchocerca flexuosa TaxID=387005 RepID=A0A183HWS8_9BILA|nr:unnamed protein product [Onchocerca flexuosa]